jgi:hypothetical protein
MHVMKVVAHPLKWSASQYKRWPSPGNDQHEVVAHPLKWSAFQYKRGGPPLEMISLYVMKVVAHPLEWSASKYKRSPFPGNDQHACNESGGPSLEIVSFPI